MLEKSQGKIQQIWELTQAYQQKAEKVPVNSREWVQIRKLLAQLTEILEIA